MTTPLVDVRSLKRRYGPLVAVDGISFSVRRGEVLGFLGPNGAGKSTTMKMIAGFLSPTSGTAIVAGEDVRASPVEAKRKMGYLPENSPLYGDMTAEGFLDFVGRARLMSREARRRAVEAVIERLGLGDMRHRRIETLSKGYRRRVGVAQAILHDPEVLILDEPTDGLDPNQKHEVRELIRAVGERKAIIISTHALDEVDTLCERAIIINNGRIVVDASKAQLYASSPDYNAVAFTVSGSDAGRARKLLKALPEVSAVEAEDRPDGTVRITVRPRGGLFIADLVGASLRENRLAASDIHALAPRLEDVFRSITTDAPAAGAG